MPNGVRPINQKPWKPNPEARTRLDSAVLLAKVIAKQRGLYEPHRRHILSIAIWKATEAHSKMNPRYRSIGVARGALGTPVNHEHVVTRKFLVDALIADPGQIEQIMDLAVGCLVTREEHKRLSWAGSWGWRRYIDARVSVIDGETETELNLASEDRRLRRIAKEAGLQKL